MTYSILSYLKLVPYDLQSPWWFGGSVVVIVVSVKENIFLFPDF